jgi:glycosyltransferase involved in cell wall biosynthesis
LLPGTGLDDPTYRRVCSGLTQALRRQGIPARAFCPRRGSLRSFRAFAPEVLHLHFSGHLSAEARRWTEVFSRGPGRLVLTFQDLDHPDLPHPDAPTRREISALVKKATRVTAVCGSLARLVLRRYPDAAGKLSVIGNGVGREWLAAGKRNEDSLVVAISRLAPYKGIDLLLWAFRAFCDREPSARLCVFGKDFQGGHYQRLARRLHLEGRVRFAGSVSGSVLRGALHRARVFVSASRRETYGMAVLEALACGTPVLATRVGAAKELLRHRRDAWLIAPGDWLGLERGLRSLWHDAVLRGRLARAGIHAARGATWDSRAAEYARIYYAGARA